MPSGRQVLRGGRLEGADGQDRGVLAACTVARFAFSVEAGSWAFLDEAWRYPAHSPRDLCVLEAIPPPPGTWLPMNGLVYSRHGALNTEMAGGDLDGDLVQASWLHRRCVSPGMRAATALSCQRKDAVSALCQIALWAALIQFPVPRSHAGVREGGAERIAIR